MMYQKTFALDKQSRVMPKTNIAVMQNLAAIIAKQVVGHSAIAQGESVVVDFQPGEDNWIAQNAFVTSLTETGCRVFATNLTGKETAFTVIDISGVDLKVRYDDMFRDGLLGTKMVQRTVSVGLSCRVTHTQSKEIIFSNSLSESASDTVTVESIGSLELLSAKVTHADLPSEVFFDRILEPFVIVGATGVAIYLFFHIRS